MYRMCFFEKKLEKKSKENSKRLKIPAKKNASLANTSHERVTVALKQERLKCNQLQKEINRMKAEIENKYIRVDKEISEDIEKIMSDNVDEITPFIKLFWDQQRKFFSEKKKPLCYHPMIIRFSLSLASKSPAVYDELRNSGVLVCYV